MKWYQRIVQRLITKYLVNCAGTFKAGKDHYVTIATNDEYHAMTMGR